MRLLLRRCLTVGAVGLAVLAAVALNLAGCHSGMNQETGGSSAEAPSNLGEPIKGDVPTVSGGGLTEEKLGQTVAVEGEIIQQCPASGCWLKLKTADGETFVDLLPSPVRLSENRLGQSARVTGEIVRRGSDLAVKAKQVEFGRDQDAKNGEP